MTEGFSKSELLAWADYQQSFGCVAPESEVRNEFWSYGEFELVGHGKQTNDKCGSFNKFMGCLNVEAHNASRWFNPDLKKDSVFVKSVYHSCDKPTCPKCFKFGWAVREASRMEKRLQEASVSYGLVEHIVASVPVELYGLGLEALRKAVPATGKAPQFRLRLRLLAQHPDVNLLLVRRQLLHPHPGSGKLLFKLLDPPQVILVNLDPLRDFA